MTEPLCRICGQPVPPVEALSDSEWGEIAPAFRAMLERAAEAVCCDSCIETHEAGARAAAAKQAIADAISKAIHIKDLPADIMAHGFRHSEPEKEAMNPNAWATARTYKRADGNLWIHGTHGTGKTRLAHAVIHRAVSRGIPCACVSALALVAKLQTFDKGRDALDRWQAVPVLLFDDIDKMPPTTNNLTALWHLFDARKADNLTTICTANRNVDALSSAWALRSLDDTETIAAALDRLKPCLILEMTGKSQRGDFRKVKG